MRRFWLRRGDKTWDLSSNSLAGNAGFLANPEGLGVKVKIESFEIEGASFIESVKSESGEISGKLYFSDYEHFGGFVDFIGVVETTEPLRLYYKTDAAAADLVVGDDWYKLVLIKELKKGGIDVKTGCLVCGVKFAALSRWKKDKVITLELKPFGSPLIYPYYYSYVYGGTNNMAVEIDNTGNLPTSCIVKVEAETDTPLFRIVKGGKVVEQAKYKVYIRAGSYLLVNSAPEAQEASIYTGDYREDVYYLGEKDYAYSNFLTIPEGKSTFLFTAANAKFGPVTLQYSLQREII